MMGTVVTGSFVMAAVGAFYLLVERQERYGRMFVRLGAVAGVASTCLMLATGDQQGKNVTF
jgi:cytochrome bd ubiquinol oxidase subunit I